MDMIPALVQSQSPVKKGLGKDGSSGQSAVEKERETIMLAKSTVCWPRVHVGGEPVVPQGQKQLPLLAGAARTILPILQWEKKGFASGFKLFNFIQWNKDKRNRPRRLAVLQKIQSTLRLHGMRNNNGLRTLSSC